MHYWKHIHFCPIIFLIILLYLAVLFWERKALFACFGHVGRHEQINKTWWERVGKSHLCLSFRKYHCYIIPPQILYWGTMACTHLSWLGGCRPIATSAMALQPCLTVYGGTFYVLERNNARNKRENSLSWVKGVFFCCWLLRKYCGPFVGTDMMHSADLGCSLAVALLLQIWWQFDWTRFTHLETLPWATESIAKDL